MICLGIECTAHTFGIGICDEKGRILANEKSVYKSAKGWGIIPSEAAKHHNEKKEDVLKKALNFAKMKIDDIDIFAYSRGPGLPPCLHEGANFVRHLSEIYKKPIVGVNHCI
ncbi:MAG: O-sialoglycoprotein endopeptidase, partial [Candidatus Aenigmatarchaeota archaeon]